MFDAWITLILFLTGGRAFMIHNTQCSLCLEESEATGEVLLKTCNLDSLFQQWVWINQGMLMCVASSRCLSAQQTVPVETQPCQGSAVDAAGLMWDCDRGRLISRNTSMLLSTDGRGPIQTHVSKDSKWSSLDKGDICHENLRLRRSSDEPDDFKEEQKDKQATMTEEQKEYLRWYYRTEDQTTWKFVMLGLSFICLLVGFLLLGMGAIASKSRKKIAKYKAAASLAQKHEGEMLQTVSLLRDNSCSKPSSSSPSAYRLQGNNHAVCDSELSELRAGSIVVTWKDGNTSCLYPDPAVQEQEEEREEKQEVLAAELQDHEEAKSSN